MYVYYNHHNHPNKFPVTTPCRVHTFRVEQRESCWSESLVGSTGLTSSLRFWQQAKNSSPMNVQ